MMRKLLTTVAAVATSICVAGGIAWSLNLPLLNNIALQEPSQELAALNSLIVSLNFNTSGVLGYIPGPVGNVATTVIQNLASTTIATGQLTLPGQRLKARCSGISNSNTNSKTLALYVGTAVVTSTALTGGGQNWDLELDWTAATSPVTANYTWIGRALAASTTGANSAIDINSGNDTAVGDNIANNSIPISCKFLDGTSAQGDVTMESFTVEQVK